MMMKTAEQISTALNITAPFLMIDNYELIEKGKTAIATKSISVDDWFFECHLPKSGVMPGTLQIEGMLQTLVLLIYDSFEHGEHRAYVNNINVKLMKAVTVTTCSELRYEATILSMRRGICKGEVIALCDGTKICAGTFSYASPHLMAVPKSAE
ncbi:hypothetical protein EXT48_04000 [Pseudoalteromonas sp. CO348]|uniref:3-hydroxyacyl-ACP dehydratase FabZ family protein n=1 Tax=Pseudoalteromonas sp. CO348 TaxID=1777271 RepID=UPI001022E0A7|nr:FabA/FabZ family ACP-dehydratase [Pseudoalteromonas sp. CO348]RZG08256.1 hypothetical protein EXT48_04000 [Pseudoalteromonas sp. CO348]